ncbi:MAG: glutamate synthase-related protein [Microscillaceae bacterium]
MKNHAFSQEKSACGVGFIASRQSERSHELVQKALFALQCEEHRGACAADQRSSDGAGLMTDIPSQLLGYPLRKVAVAMLFAPTQPEVRRAVLEIFAQTFAFMDLEILKYREVPVNPAVLGAEARQRMPYIVQAFIQRPAHCRTDGSFDKLLYIAKQYTRTKLKKKHLPELFFASLSTNTIVYKALTRAQELAPFYLDLQNPDYKSRFALFHRRFSTNTSSTWDRAQPFRIIGHNGEFNTITGNRSWAISREMAMGLYAGELLTESGVSDSGSLNEMVEAMLYRSSIPYIDEVLAILMPPASKENAYYKFWSRAMEPWDGPALITYSDGENIGARLDRNGFRPCRWAMTESHFYLSSEAGSFALDEREIISKGALKAGSGVRMSLKSGNVYFVDPSRSQNNFDAQFDARTYLLPTLPPKQAAPQQLYKKFLFHYTQEDLDKVLIPMMATGKESIGSMGDTARLAIFSKEPRSLFDYFCHNFAQVTNPPLDYLREKNVTDLRTYLGRKPNIFAKKDLLPSPVGYELPSPILSLGQMEALFKMMAPPLPTDRIRVQAFEMTYPRDFGTVGFKTQLEELGKKVKKAVDAGVSIIILTDQNASYEHPPLPSLLAVGAVVSYMREHGQRLKFSVVVHSGEIRTTHQIATTIGMGATAVCPYLALEMAHFLSDKALDALQPETKEQNLLKAYEGGLLKIMSKMGISVVRSYQSARLYTSIGLSEALITQFFKGVTVKLPGIGLEEIVRDLQIHLERARHAEEADKLLNAYLYKEHARGLLGEKHSMTATRAKLVHQLVREKGLSLDQPELYEAYLKAGYEDEPVAIRHLFQLKKTEPPLDSTQVQDRTEILKKFGSGAMSFGAISAEAQRDIFWAMHEIGGRSNSGEGGENPYYFSEGITAYSKQVASGRFGVNALYLVSGEEIQIKIAQGAKPGEGGQLMGVKVDAHIAKARHAYENVDLISPPPMHDIYSIEDLKQLIYELKQLKPGVPVNVKLVAGAGIGTIACGVAKAGADVIHISGGEGGTGAAALSSMKHAGLPWEFGLAEVHEALLDNQLRHLVRLRTDGGLHSGREILIAAILGAEEFDFGKLLLIAQGCIMARICEKNTCPTGIATHDPRFKAKYKGTKDHIVKMMHYLAEDVRTQLCEVGVHRLEDLIGRRELLMPHPAHLGLIQAKKLDLSFALGANYRYEPVAQTHNFFNEDTSPLNTQILKDTASTRKQQGQISLHYPIQATDRAVPATLCGAIAQAEHASFAQQFEEKTVKMVPEMPPFQGHIELTFTGSAGQSFGAYLVSQVTLRLFGEANDSVGKTMSGGRLIITPHPEARFKAEENVIVGNVALYGATGGRAYINGLAADRFAVRNSGAVAVVEGAGLHACEYMTRGKVLILGETSENVGSGMTGGEVILMGKKEEKEALVNPEYLTHVPLLPGEFDDLKSLIEDYQRETQSARALEILKDWDAKKELLQRFLPHSQAQKLQKTEILDTEEV